MPQTSNEWADVAAQFESKWNFPNCIGAIDGKHIAIRPPKDSGSYYFNYKGSHSIVLLAAVNANYEFMFADIGTNGRVSDGGVWRNCKLRDIMETQTSGVPGAKRLPGSSISVPHVFLADDAFPLTPYLMKPFSFRNQTKIQRIFSYRLSRARRTVENAFGILANRFRVLQTTIALEPSKVEKVVLACIALHNYLRKNSAEQDTPPYNLHTEYVAEGPMANASLRQEESLLNLRSDRARKPSQEAKDIRDKFMSYFINEGAVPWQG